MKDLNSFLEDDSTLIENFYPSNQSGVDDSNLEEVYRNYQNYLKEYEIISQRLNSSSEENSNITEKEESDLKLVHKLK